MKRRVPAELTLAALLFAAGVWLYLSPSIPSLRGHLGPDLGDPRLNLYFVTWVAHCLESGLDGLWSPPFFHPTPGVLALSDHLIGPGALVWIAGKLGIGNVTTFNLLFLASFVLSGLVAFEVFRRLDLSLWPALLGGWFVAFSHQRWDEISHYQVLRAQWIPAVLYAFDRFLARPRPASATAFLLFYALHVSGGTYLTYMIHVPMAVVLTVRLREAGWRGFFSPERARWLVGSGGATVAVLMPFIWGYVVEWGSRTLGRQAWEIRSAGAVLASFAAPSHDALARGLGFFAEAAGRGALFPGFVLLAGCLALWATREAAADAGSRSARWRTAAVAAIGAAVAVWGLSLADAYTQNQSESAWLTGIGLRRYNGPRAVALLGLAAISWSVARRRATLAPRAPRDPFVTALVAGGGICLWLALPVGFTTVNRLLPGMSGMRVSHRFFAFTLLALAYLGARGIEVLGRRVASRPLRVALLAALSVVAVAEATPRRWEWVAVPERSADFPGYAKFLAENRGVLGYVEAPLLGDYNETERMHLQSLHWRPMVNGYSARFPVSYRRFEELFTPLPDEAGLARLRAAGVSHLVVHLPAGRMPSRSWARRLANAAVAAVQRKELALEFESETSAVFRILEATENATEQRSAPEG